MKIEINKYYRTRAGQTVYIVGIDPHAELDGYEDRYIAVGYNGACRRDYITDLARYNVRGSYLGQNSDEHDFDIIEEIE